MDYSQLPEIVNQSFSKVDLKKLTPQKGCVWIDQFKALLSAVPYAGGFLAQEIQNIQDYKAAEFCRKYTAYIYSLEPHSEADREKFCKDVESQAWDYSGNVIMGIVDRLDNINKQCVLANLTSTKIKGQISIEDFFRLASMLERIPYVDLRELPKYGKPYYDESGDTDLLFATGALRLAILDGENNNSKYVLSALGQKLIEFGFNTPISVEFDGLKIGLPIATDEDIDKMMKNFKLPEKERQSIIDEARPQWEVLDGGTLSVK